jgi:hypothetical protein
MSNVDPNNCPPQFVFEMIIAQVARRFLSEDKAAEEIVAETVEAFSDLYSILDLDSDLLGGLERLFGFIESVQITDVDLMLLSFIWYSANYEKLDLKRKKKPLFGNPLKGQPRLTARVYNSAVAFKAFAYAMGANKAPIKPTEWKPTDEVEFESIFALLFPEDFKKDDKPA